jgi:hypothetical protein
VRRATPQEVAYPTGYFSEPVRAWPGLCDYACSAPEVREAVSELPKTYRADTYVGKPCPHGHDGTRYVKDWTCVYCARARSIARNIQRKNP